MGLAFTGIFLGLHGIDRWAYLRDPAWAEFSEYNRMRGEIHRTALEKFIPQAAPTVGWSENDGWMFSQFYFSDADVYAGVPKMRRLLDKLKELARDNPASPRTFSASFLLLPKIFGGDAGTLMNLAILNAIWCVSIAGTFRRRCLVTLLISYGLFVVLSFYLLMSARLPERVSYNIPLFINAICFYWAISFHNPPITITRPGRLSVFLAFLLRPEVLRRAALVLIPVWIALYLVNLSQLVQSLRVANTFNRNLEYVSHKIFKPMLTVLPAQKKPILVAMPWDSVLEQSLFFHPSAEKVPFFLMPYGWITHSPLFNQILDQHHLRPYSLSLVNRPDVFFLMEERWLEPLRTFYREHYGLNIRFDMVLNTDEMQRFEYCDLHLYQAHIVASKVPLTMDPR